jgi:hypothetical protein
MRRIQLAVDSIHHSEYSRPNEHSVSLKAGDFLIIYDGRFKDPFYMCLHLELDGECDNIRQ